MKTAYFDCFSGISGDMTIAAFLDAGLPMKTLEDGLAKLKIRGYSLKKSKVRRGSIAGTKFDCVIKNNHQHNHHSLKEILSIIDRSALNGNVKSIAGRIFNAIGTVEARVHGVRSASDVRLHELGEIDSIIDIVGTAIAVDALGIEKVYASAVTMGRTSVLTKHGMIPIPGPAALGLLKGVPVTISDDVRAELVTPTGAGILATLAESFGGMPCMKASRIGYGAGSRELPGMPNMLRIVIGESVPAFKTDVVTVIEANIDDMNPQYFEHLFGRLLDAGALDVFVTPVQMKKTRPAFLLTAVCRRGDVAPISSIIFRETTTIGVRFHESGRFVLDRTTVKVKTVYGHARVKMSEGPDGIRIVSPEYEDCVRIAKSKQMPLKVVCEAVKAAAK